MKDVGSCNFPQQDSACPLGYKQTEVGVIPEEWVDTLLGTLFSFKNGLNKSKKYFGYGTPIVNYMDVYKHPGLLASDLHGLVDVSRQELDAFGVRRGDVFFTRTSETVEEVGISSVLLDDSPDTVFSGFVLRARPKNDALSDRLKKYCFSSRMVRHQIVSKSTYTTRALTNGRMLSAVVMPIPPTKAEQEAIAEALSDADALIESLEQLLAKKRYLKQGVMQQLLTDKMRLPGFSGEWGVKRIAEIGLPSSEKNNSAEQLPVLTCSKHLGFIDSLSYFKNQVFSRDTSGYKMIRRGQIGYPSNHIEEGSIGLQDLYDVALVSPIYVVFSVTDQVNSYFLYRLLKLDSYRQQFESATTASVDRRGSLRWPAFSQINVILPGIKEQTAIANTLSDMDAEITVLTTKLAKARLLKAGMMQELLTGRIRLK